MKKETEAVLRVVADRLLENPNDESAYDYLTEELNLLGYTGDVINKALTELKAGKEIDMFALFAGISLGPTKEKL